MTEETKKQQDGETLEPEKKPIEVHRLFLTGAINGVMYDQFAEFISKVHLPDVLYFEINSGGGDPELTNVMVDQIMARQTATVVIATGQCCSAAGGFLGISGSTRLAYLSTVFMQHRAMLSLPKCFLDDPAHAYVVSQEQQELYRGRIQRIGGLTDEELGLLFGRLDLYFSAVDALCMGTRGLIDGIIYRELAPRDWIVLTRDGFKNFRWPFDVIADLPVMTEEELAKHNLAPYKPNLVVKAFERLKNEK